MIYLDNAATTFFKPPQVTDAVMQCLTKLPFNPNRGSNKFALPLQQMMLETRRKLWAIFHNDGSNHVAFCSGCTQALNLAILGNARRGHIIVSATEHNSVLRPVMQLKRRGLAEVSIVFPNQEGQVTADAVDNAWQDNTFLVCVAHVSNVTGQKQNLQPIGQLVRRRNALFLSDCAQSAGYIAMDMEKNCVDLAAIGAHKGLHAMQGVGALMFNQRSLPRPITFGGTGTESHNYFQPHTVPDCLESGTPPTPAIAAMSAGLDFWLQQGKQNCARVQHMQRLLLDGLKLIKGVKVFSPPNKSGIVAFNIGDMGSTEVADLLLQKDIVTRGGLHCAPLMHRFLGTAEQGAVRASVSCTTTQRECFVLLNAVEEIAGKM